MDKFFGTPTPAKVAQYIYNQVVCIHETGGKTYRYHVSPNLSISFINDVIDRLSYYVHEAETIELLGEYIVIDWS
jgi:hypothetical protein